MRPGTMHMVMTLTASLTVGGIIHFPFCYTRTLDAIIDEHLWGQRLSNVDYVGSHLALFLLLGYYGRRVGQHCIKDQENGQSLDIVCFQDFQAQGKLCFRFANQV